MDKKNNFKHLDRFYSITKILVIIVMIVYAYHAANTIIDWVNESDTITKRNKSAKYSYQKNEKPNIMYIIITPLRFMILLMMYITLVGSMGMVKMFQNEY